MRRRASAVECIGAPTCVPTAKEAEQGAVYPYRVFLGSKRMPYATWVKSASMYVWPLWRNWTGPKVVKVETGAEVFARHLRDKPAGYSWRLERLTPAQRLALGCLPPAAAKPSRPTTWRVKAGQVQ